MIRITKDGLWEFIKANRALSKEEIEDSASRTLYDCTDWIGIYNACGGRYDRSKDFLNIRTVAANHAALKAVSLIDWVHIIEDVEEPWPYAVAVKKFIEFDITRDEDISILNGSSSELLKSIGWYLSGKRELALTKSK